MFTNLLIANRGEIACRVIRTARRLGLRTIALYSDADRDAPHVKAAHESWHLGPAPAMRSYLDIERVLDIAHTAGAEAIHPGYGFLSENPEFALACEERGIVFVGPPAQAIRTMGLKDAARRLMAAAGVPVVPGYHEGERADTEAEREGKESPEALLERAIEIGFPVLIKAVAGGGGKGMRLVDGPDRFIDALAGARREALSAFANDRVLIERYITRPRHIEVQVFADSAGNAVHLFERDCSVQRRHQKVIEEAPAPGMSEAMRLGIGEIALMALRAIDYRGAGTIEFIADASQGLRADRVWFMEMNTRLQVEHPITEMITGTDLVEWQLRIAAKEPLPLDQEALSIRGHAVEARLCAEDPARDFRPATGKVVHLRSPPADADLRIEIGIDEGGEIGPHYDPMIAKIVAHGKNREQALDRLSRALGGFELAGVATNRRFLARIVDDPVFRSGEVETGFISDRIDALVTPEPIPEAVLAGAALIVGGRIDADLAGSRQGHRRSDGRDRRNRGEARLGAWGDPWSAHANWRLWGNIRQPLSFMLDEAPIEATLGIDAEGECRIDIESGLESGLALFPRAISHDLDLIRFELERRREEVRFSPSHHGIHLFHLGESFLLSQAKGARQEEEAGGGEDRIVASLPGKVVDILVQAGECIERGSSLAVLEAMKMELSVDAPRSGLVERVHVAVGDSVAEDTVLITLASDDPASQDPAE
ncbi:acetyl/propionyl/methylcrotonyl-CoA carboxylase subunit alpha [Thioalkalivibrio sp. HK1]|uniref:acetyl/propionyl/methylcrotonyl-CoA carboxylase subunit alpha n=1 Tax=Thioalkalivibrio sp. HK1 TaxID=1469245 RepID=UPI000470BE12|nr:biotin carboxylase N-terminal domain-containing protein [Thioalkalivibrio sp. HK1]